MVDLVAKRYVKALMVGSDTQKLTTIYDELKVISTAFADDKFLLIIGSSDVDSDKKVELILSFVDNCSQTVANLIKLLAQKKRLDIIPDIVKELKFEIAVLTNTYDGVIYTSQKLADDEVEKLTNQFAKKFDVNLTLNQNICDYDGIKVDIDGLGCEISFSKERLRTQMIEHILKAV